MPVFGEPNCMNKMIMYGIGFIALTMLITKIFGFVGGFLGATVGMLLSLIIMWYLIDQFGDTIFTDNKYINSSEKIEQCKDSEIHFN